MKLLDYLSLATVVVGRDPLPSKWFIEAPGVFRHLYTPTTKPFCLWDFWTRMRSWAGVDRRCGISGPDYGPWREQVPVVGFLGVRP